MKVLVYDAIRCHINPNPDIIGSIIRAFERVGGVEHVRHATQWDVESIADVHRPDLILAVSARIYAELVAPLAVLRHRLGCTVGWWLTDDPYEIDCSLQWADHADFVATNNRESVAIYRGVEAIHVPLAADAERHFRPVRTDDAAYEWDVVFCGVGFANRRAVIEAAAPTLNRCKTRIIGPEWPRLPFVSPERIDNAALTDLYNASRIVLNLPRSLNAFNRHDFPASTPAPRTFEAAAAGGFQLAAADRPELHDCFDIPSELDLFANAQEFEQKLKWYLANPDLRIQAAQKAQDRVLRDHTYDRRAAGILDYVRSLSDRRNSRLGCA